MKRFPHTIAAAALLLAGGVHAQNSWNGAGVTGGTISTDWTDAANYTATPTFNSTTDLKFSTITNAAGGVVLSAGTGGTYAVRDLYFGEVTTLGSGQLTAQTITLNGNGTQGATILDLNGGIYMPSTASIVTLGSDLTLNLSSASHPIRSVTNANVTSAQPVLVINSLITGSGGSAAGVINTYTSDAVKTSALILTNNNNSFIATMPGGGGGRYDNQVGYTSISAVGGGNSSVGKATDAASGRLVFGNSANFNYIGSGDQTTDREMVLGGTTSLGNSSSGTTLTFTGAITTASGLRVNVTSGATMVISSALGGTTTVSKQGSGTYFDATGATATNDGAGLFVLAGDNTFSGAVTVGAGTLRTDHANALGSTAGATSVSSGATLDLNGQAVGAEAVSINGTGAGSAGALRNSSASAASLGGNVTLTGNASIGATGNLTLSGVVAQSGGTRNLTKIGAGELILNGVNTYTGTTTVSAGSLGGIGSISTGAATFAAGTTLNPGDGATTGQFSFGGNLTLSNDAVFSVSLNQSAGNAYDRVAVAGTTTLTGSILNVSLLSGFDGSAQTGQTFSILTSTGTLTGQFDQGTSVSATSGAFTYDFAISYTGNVVTLTLNNISAVPEPSTWALIAGVASLGVVVLRRRR